MDLNVIWQIGIVVGAFVIGACSRFIPLGTLNRPDNAIEEIMEDMIEQETGIEIDLSPGSPEEKSIEIIEEN